MHSIYYDVMTYIMVFITTSSPRYDVCDVLHDVCDVLHDVNGLRYDLNDSR